MQRLLLALLLSAGAVVPALAAPAFTFTVGPIPKTLPPSGSAELSATLTNTGDTSFAGIYGDSETLIDPFNFTPIDGFELIDFATPLAPGESVTVDFGALTFAGLTPGQSYVPFSGIEILLGDADGNTTSSEVAVLPTVTGGAPAVPEPATWLMMIAGFGVLGAALRRRRPGLRFA